MSRWQLLPPLSADELATLRADIEVHGVVDPVEVDEDGEIIDGHHRAAIADELGLLYQTVVRSGWTDDEIVEHVFRKHLGRRQLTTPHRQALAVEMRKRLAWSGRKIAEAIGVSEGTVRTYLSGAQDYAPDTTVTGSDGKSYPASLRARALANNPELAEQEERLQRAQHWLRLLDRLSPLIETTPTDYVPQLTEAERDLTRLRVEALARWLDRVETALADVGGLRVVAGR